MGGMAEEQDGEAPLDEGGDPACWAHLFDDEGDENDETSGTGGGTTGGGVDLPSP